MVSWLVLNQLGSDFPDSGEAEEAGNDSRCQTDLDQATRRKDFPRQKGEKEGAEQQNEKKRAVKTVLLFM